MPIGPAGEFTLSKRRILKIFLLFVPVTAACLLFFQNCSDFRLAKNLLASEALYQQDVLNLATLMGSADRLATYASDVYISDGSGPATLPNQFKNTLFSESRFFLSPMNRGLLTFTNDPLSNRMIWAHAPTSLWQTSLLDNLITENLTIFLHLRGTLKGDILSINSGSRGTEDFQLLVEDGSLKAVHFTDPNNASQATLPLPEQDALIVAASFDKDPGIITLMVNGSFTKTVSLRSPSATPGTFLKVLRQLQIGPSQADGQMAWGEAHLFLRTLTPYEMNLLSRDMASRWNIPNVIDNPAARADGGGVSSTPASPEFTAAQAVLNNRCVSCHESAHSSWSGKKPNYFISQGLIVPGNAAASPLYQRLINNGGDMPRSGSALPQEEIDALVNWINHQQ